MARRRKSPAAPAIDVGNVPVYSAADKPQPAQFLTVSGYDRPCAVWQYASIGELASVALDARFVNPSNAAHYFLAAPEYQGGGPVWFGLPPDCGLTGQALHDRCAEVARDGWPDGAQRIQDNVRALTNATVERIPCQRRRPRWSDQGEHLDYDRMRAGQFDQCWRRAMRAPVPMIPLVRIAVLACANHSTDAEQLFWRGAAAVALADLLNESGYNVDLWAAYGSILCDGQATPDGSMVCVKPALAPYSLSHAAAGLAFPGTFRSLIIRSRLKIAERQLDAGASRTQHALALAVVRASVASASGARCCIADETVNCRAAALAWVESQLQSLQKPVAQAA